MFGIEFCPKKSSSAYVYLPPPLLRVELWGFKDLKLFYSITNNFYFKLFFMRSCVIYYYLFIYLFINPWNTNLKCLKKYHWCISIMTFDSVKISCMVATGWYRVLGKKFGVYICCRIHTFNLIPILLAYGFLVERTDLKFC